MRNSIITIAFGMFLTVTPALANEDTVFGSGPQDRDLPVEVEADELAVNQDDGTATLTGNVVITQGEMILSAPYVFVVYTEDNDDIESLEAKGGVTMVSGPDEAEADNAIYRIGEGTVLLTGNVLLNREGDLLSGERVTIDLETGTANASGRVRTTLLPAD